MQVLHDTFADDPTIRVLGAHVGAGDQRMSGRETVPEYAEAGGYTYPMVADGRDIASAFEVTAIPYFIVVGPDGTIVAEHRGMLRDEARDRLADAARAARPSR
ncbi:MAG: hypothetical protein Tsb0013_09870 [Phycisphaerales bacterium]